MASASTVTIVDRDDQYILNHCTKHLARANQDERHNYGQFAAGDLRGRIAEAHHFPVVDTHFDGHDQVRSYGFNDVSFVYFAPTTAPQLVEVVGTFANHYERVPLRPVLFQGESAGYWAVTVVLPKGEAYTYKYLVDGELQTDPINPQQVRLDNGEEWSQFFTQLCTEALQLEVYEQCLLDRLVAHILPFQTDDGERFLNYFYDFLDRQTKTTQFIHAYRLDQAVGVVNFIDKLLAREENHHLLDYKLCLGEIDRVLRLRNPFLDPGKMAKEEFIQLYEEMARDDVPGWDKSVYGSPRFFLQLLRRHTFTGAFSHPRHGGNVGGVGWAYLAEKFRTSPQETLFDWRRALEIPLGTNPDYRG
jgi:hypothetical protein